jgi:hypothetical protein
MDVTQPIHRSFADEHVIGIDPPLRPELPNVWRRRINAFVGRALSETAMSAEQSLRSGMQRLYGLALTPGTVEQLVVSADADAMGRPPAEARIQVSAGLGLARSGEDVTIGRTVRLPVGDLPVIMRIDHADALSSDSVIVSDAASEPLAPADRPGGGMTARIRPEQTRILGPTLAAIAANAESVDLPHVAVLVAQPVYAELLGRPLDPCPPHPSDDAYVDLQRIDGTRLALYLWPSEMVAFDGGADYALPADNAARRNRLAYAVFEIERLFAEGEMHPWEGWGLPLALIGFGEDWKLSFIDRHAVARIGGAPKERTPIVANSGDARLWQAQLDQFAAQLSDMPSFEAGALQQSFVRLPPVGILPPNLFDPILRRQHFFPPGFNVTAVPVAHSNLNLVAAESAALAPIDSGSPEPVELLIPVPDDVYEPGLLQVEQEDSRFGQAIKSLRQDRQRWLVRRQMARRRYDRLMETVSGVVMGWPGTDLPLEENSPAPYVQTPVEVTRTRRIAANTAKRSHVMTGANATLTVSASDKIWCWVCIHDRARLTGLSIRFATGSRGDTATFTKGVFWGVADAMPIAAEGGDLEKRRIGDLPESNAWVRLEVPASAIWDAAGGTLEAFAINGVEFTQRGGDVEWASFGKEDAAGLVYTYIADDAPAGATLTAEGEAGTVAWPWTTVSGREEFTVSDFGTVVTNDVRRASALDKFRAEWTQDFLKADLDAVDENGIDAFVAAVDARLSATNDAVDLGFVRARSDIYRVRQIMLGADAASRLVTSPALADLSLRDEGARATSRGISEFLVQALARKPDSIFKFGPPAPVTEEPPAPPPRTIPPPPPAPEFTAGRLNLRKRKPTTAMFSNLSAFQPQMMVLNAMPIVAPPPPPPAPIIAAVAMPLAVATPLAMVRPALATPFFEASAIRAPVFQPAVTKAAFSIEATRLSFDTGRYRATDIQRQIPIAGLVERTITVAERLTPQPSVQALEYALASKAVVIATLSDLSTGGAAHPKGIALGDIPIAGYIKKSDPNVVPTLSDLFADEKLPRAQQLFEDTDKLPEQVGEKHEADYFTLAVQAIDNSIAIMRLVEGRIALFQKLAGSLHELRAAITGSADEAASYLRAVDVEVAEARHDLGTAERLRNEDRARVALVNARRAAILQNQVRAIAWRRARAVDIRDELPLIEVASGLAPDAVAVCRREHEEVPSEIHDYVQLLREVPVSWFPAIAARIRRIELLDSAHNAIRTMFERAVTPRLLAAAAEITAGNRYLKGVQNAMVAGRRVVEARRMSVAMLDIARIPLLSLREAHAQLSTMATIGDLIAGSHRQPALTRAASDEIEAIASIAGCLHESFGEVAPIVRLGWAEALSEFDRPAPLANLAGLQGWGEVPMELRRTLQGFVDWLFSRINRSEDAAEDAINELVRICLLMAAHSPVDKIIPAHLVAPVPAKLGSRLFLTLDISRVRRGMTALVRDDRDRIISRAVVDDIVDGRAQATVTHIESAITTITPSMRFQLVGGIMR